MMNEFSLARARTVRRARLAFESERANESVPTTRATHASERANEGRTRSGEDDGSLARARRARAGVRDRGVRRRVDGARGGAGDERDSGTDDDEFGGVFADANDVWAGL